MNYCLSHQREATHYTERGDPICNPALGSLTIPCKIVMFPTLGGQLQDYLKQVYPNGTGEIQKRELTMCWYAAALSTFNVLSQCADLTDDAAEKVVSRLDSELQIFRNSIRAS